MFELHHITIEQSNNVAKPFRALRPALGRGLHPLPSYRPKDTPPFRAGWGSIGLKAEVSNHKGSKMKKSILPQIVGGAEESLRAYEQGARPDGGNNFDNYMLGCACWNNVYNRLERELTNHPFFLKKTYKKSMAISCQNGEKQLKFYVSRVDENGRVPCAGKSIKLQLQLQTFLSDEIKYLIECSESSVFMLAYDISAMTGLGKITFNMLSATGRGRFQSDTLYVFEDQHNTTLAQHMPQEEIKRPVVTREVLSNPQKTAM